MASFRRADLRKILGDAYTDEIGNELVSLHLGVVDPLKDDLEKYKADAEKVPGLTKEIESLKGGEDWKAKYEKEKADHDAYRAQVAKDADIAKVRAAYRSVLIEEKISEQTIDSILNATDFSGIKLTADGKIENLEQVKNDINSKWGGFKVTTTPQGARVDNPPNNNGNTAKKTMEEIYARDEHGRYKLSTEERQKALQENLQKGS